jgi:hypothetical protein
MEEDPNFFGRHFPFTKFRTQTEADAWFDAAWKQTNASQKNATARAFFQKTQRSAGGAAGSLIKITKDAPKMHDKLAMFLAAVDTWHDFDVLPSPDICPDGCPAFTNENVFLKRLANMERLKWGDNNIIDNPAYKGNFMDYIFNVNKYIREEASFESLWQRQQNHYRGKNGTRDANFIPVDIWNIFANREVLEIQQFAECLGVMRKCFGSRRFVVDASGDALWYALHGLRYINKTFWRRFVVEPRVDIAELDSKIRQYILTLDPALDEIEWIIETVDANLWDAGNNASGYPLNKNTSTGPIFPKALGVQIELNGIIDRCERRVVGRVTDVSRDFSWTLTNRQTTQHFSVNHLINILDYMDFIFKCIK